ncbi:hypothetical protein [Indioceanicola profundi]|uniref:hypothetical protein n=1 Tax=Indioceanicola profundi TaxID=2220096 RepID=UPI000E6AC3AE|nr:hypothetical protein [Indioceanicola profundi]
MYLQIADSDVVVLSLAAACLAAAIVMELLRIVLPDIYEWIADYAAIKVEITRTRNLTVRTLEGNRRQAVLRERRNAERFRLKSKLSRTEMTLAALESDRVEVLHELGEAALGSQLFIARVSHRRFADASHKDFDSAPCIWRYGNVVRIWASQERAARSMLQSAFPAAKGYSVGEMTQVQVAAKPMVRPAAASSAPEARAEAGYGR